MIPSCVFSLFGCKHKEERNRNTQECVHNYRRTPWIIAARELFEALPLLIIMQVNQLFASDHPHPPADYRRSSVHHTSFPFLFRLHPVENLLLEQCIGTVHTVTADLRKITGRSDDSVNLPSPTSDPSLVLSDIYHPSERHCQCCQPILTATPYWATESKIC